MVAQPGVYWWLQTPLADIVGLYSNVSDGPGYIVTPDDQSQKQWLQKILKTIAALRNPGDTHHKALIIAVHHPPFSAAGHESSTEMLKDLDDCCSSAQIMPDAVVSGHAHNYQHFERQIKCNDKNISVPYLIIGDSGHNADPVIPNKKSLNNPIPGNVTVEKSLDGYGYMLVNVDEKQLGFEFYQVKVDANNIVTKQMYDSASVDLSGSNLGALTLH
jgi:hypothetical protein